MTSVLEQNMPGSLNWEGSFYEQLSEYGIWNADEFWKLHFELVEMANKVKRLEKIDRELAVLLVSFSVKVFNLFVAHFNKNDVFKIQNIDADAIFNFKERFELAVEGALSGEVLPESYFNLKNPLIE